MPVFLDEEHFENGGIYLLGYTLRYLAVTNTPMEDVIVYSRNLRVGDFVQKNFNGVSSVYLKSDVSPNNAGEMVLERLGLSEHPVCFLNINFPFREHNLLKSMLEKYVKNPTKEIHSSAYLPTYSNVFMVQDDDSIVIIPPRNTVEKGTNIRVIHNPEASYKIEHGFQIPYKMDEVASLVYKMNIEDAPMYEKKIKLEVNEVDKMESANHTILSSN